MAVDKKLICQDVITRIRAKKFIAAENDFIKDDTRHEMLTAIPEHSSVQEFVQDGVCEGCAKGGVMLAYIERYNNTTVNQLLDMDYHVDSKWPKDLIETFGRVLLDEIEIAFENKFFHWHSEEIPFERSEELGRRYEIYSDLNEKLIAIMQDIIDDKF